MAKRISIKITLNEGDAFDSEIISYLSGEKNKAGQTKKLIYDRIMQLKGIGSAGVAVNTTPQLQPVTTTEGDSINEKLSKMLDF